MLSPCLALRSEGSETALIRDPWYGSPRYQTHRDETTVSLGLHYYILGWKCIRRKASRTKEVAQGTQKEEDGITRGNQNPFSARRAGIFAIITPLARTPFRNKSTIASRRRDEEAEINFFQGGITRRIADEYLGLAVTKARSLLSER